VSEASSVGGGAQKLQFNVAGHSVELDVEPHDLRSAKYNAEDSSDPGARKAADAAVTTFKGYVDGDPNSTVRISIEGNKIEGYFTNQGERFFIEPARKYTNLANEGDSVVYRAEDSLVENSFLCEADIPTQIAGGKDLVLSQSNGSLATMQDIELATDADYQYVNTVGGASQANNEILGIINMVEGVYQSDLNLSITVVYQHTWTTPDPYDSSSMSGLLTTFQSYWNANMPVASIHRDTAHLFSGKSTALSAGLSYVGVICQFPEAAYGVSGYISWAPGKYLVPAHELGHTLGANHVDASQGCDNTIMNAQLGPSTAMSFCTYSRNEIGTYVAAHGACLLSVSSTPTPTPTPVQTPTPTVTPTPIITPTPTPVPITGSPIRFDFDGDGRADISLFRPSTGTWYLNRSSSGFGGFQFGQNGDLAAPADYDGDGRTDAAVFRGGVWYRMLSSTGSFDVINFGLPGDIPAPADFDGDGRADVAVFRPSTGVWYVMNSRFGNPTAVQFGLNGDIPVAADYDGDGLADINVFRPSTGVWYRINSSNSSFSIQQFGLSGDKPVAGDFDGDGRTDIAVWRPSTGVWYVLRSSTGSFYGVQFGTQGDIPALADYDGDRRADPAVFRPSTGTWYQLNSSFGSFTALQFGTAGDVPAPAAFVP
jgi:hypothetical protein